MQVFENMASVFVGLQYVSITNKLYAVCKHKQPKTLSHLVKIIIPRGQHLRCVTARITNFTFQRMLIFETQRQ